MPYTKEKLAGRGFVKYYYQNKLTQVHGHHPCDKPLMERVCVKAG